MNDYNHLETQHKMFVEFLEQKTMILTCTAVDVKSKQQTILNLFNGQQILSVVNLLLSSNIHNEKAASFHQHETVFFNRISQLKIDRSV